MKKWGVGAAALGAFAVGGYFALSSFAHTEAQSRVAQAAGQIRRHVKQFDYAAVDVAPLSQAVEIRDVRLDDGRGRFFSVGAIRFEHFDWTARDMPRYGQIRLVGARASFDASAASGLKSYGYDHIEADAEFGYAFDDDAHTLDIMLHIAATDAGVITLRTKLGGLSPEILAIAASGNPFAILALAPAILLTEASAKFEDRSLLDRTLGAQAQRRGIGQDQVRAEIVKAITAPGNGAPDPRTAQTVETLRGFLEKPGKIKLSVAPEPPISYAELYSLQISDEPPTPEFLAKRFNFHLVRE